MKNDLETYSARHCNESEEKETKGFVIQSYLKVELAQLYSPGLSPSSAMNKLNHWIRKNPELHRLMNSGREGKNDVYYSLRQVGLLVQFLNEP